MRQRALLIAALLAVSVPMTVLAAPNGNSNGNGNNGNGNGGNGNPGTSESRSNSNPSNANNNNSNSNNNSNANKAQNNSNGNSANNVNKNNVGGNNSMSLSLPSDGTPITFGDNNQDQVSQSNEDFDADEDTSTNFKISGTIVTIADDSFTLNNGQSFSLTPEQFTFLTNNSVLTQDTRIQVIGNHANNGNVVSILKIMNPDGTKTMVRLHTNNQVSQTSVKTTGGSVNPLTAFFSQLLSLFGTITGGTGGTPSPSPSASPSASPSVSPSASPSPSDSPSPTP